MRTFMTLLLAAGIFTSFAQEPIEVKIESRPSSQGIQSAFEVVVPQAKPNDAIELWKKKIIPGGLFKKSPRMEKMKDEWIVRDIVISDITTLPLNVYTQVSSFPGNLYVRVFLQSEGGFLGSSGSSLNTTEAATRYIREYAVDLYKQAVEKELKDEENKLRTYENDLNRLHKQNKSFNNKVKVAQKDETELRNENRETEMILENNQAIIRIDTTGMGEKTAQEELEKNIRKTEKDINKARKAQSKFERKISKNEKARRNKTDLIERQKAKVEQVKTKLLNIR